MSRTLFAVVAGPLLLAATAARADETGPDTTALGDVTPNRVNLRLGGASTDSTGRPTICLDIKIISGLGIEGCGTGQGVIHDEPGHEMAHFRATWSVVERITDKGVGRLRAGLGFAELQVGVDRPGFQFGQPDPVERGSVAGPEAVVQGQWMVPLRAGVEAIASVTAGVAAFANADQLVVPKANVQPFVSVEIGVGW